MDQFRFRVSEYCGSVGSHATIISLYGMIHLYGMCWKRMNAKAQRIYIDKFHEWVVGIATAAATTINRPNTKWCHFTCTYGWFWPHGIWLQSKSRNETTSANRQEDRGLDLVVPQRINTRSLSLTRFVPFHLHFLFVVPSFPMPKWSSNT